MRTPTFNARHDKALMHMQQHGSIDCNSALQYGIHSLTDAVCILRKRGHKIITIRGETTSYKLDLGEDLPPLTKQQFDQVIRIYGSQIGFIYPLYALREMYSDYLNNTWPDAVKSALGYSADLVARFVNYNHVKAQKEKLKDKTLDWSAA